MPIDVPAPLLKEAVREALTGPQFKEVLKESLREPWFRETIKKAMGEWLSWKWQRGTSAFGSWVLRGLFASAFLGVVYLALRGAGWRPSP